MKTKNKNERVKRNPEAQMLKKDNKKKIKSLPNKPVPLGGSPFVGRHTTG
jgi:hypothetical protein